MQGIIVINKPAGFTSMDCCAIIRKLSHEKKVGHTGTLDPNATGVLPVCIGKATRLIEYMDEYPKTYIAGFMLGARSDTEDVWGNVVQNESFHSFDKEFVLEKLKFFAGDIDQIPPMYSAKKINGQKLYDIARIGKEIERKANRVHIYRCELLDFDGQNGRLEIECSRGTYIRTICADLGEVLGCGAVMTSLIRTSTCGYSLDDATDFLELKGENIKLEDNLLPIESAVNDFKKINLTNDVAALVLNGNPRYKEFLSGKISDDSVALMYDNKLLAITKNGELKKVFNENIQVVK